MKLYIERRIKTGPKAGQFRGEWLKGDTSRDEMAEEAEALLTDPKDNIVRVKVFNEKWGQFEPLTFAAGWSSDGTRKLQGIEA